MTAYYFFAFPENQAVRQSLNMLKELANTTDEAAAFSRLYSLTQAFAACKDPLSHRLAICNPVSGMGPVVQLWQALPKDYVPTQVTTRRIRSNCALGVRVPAQSHGPLVYLTVLSGSMDIRQGLGTLLRLVPNIQGIAREGQFILKNPACNQSVDVTLRPNA